MRVQSANVNWLLNGIWEGDKKAVHGVQSGDPGGGGGGFHIHRGVWPRNVLVF